MLDKFWTPFFLLFGPIYVLTLFFLNGLDWVALIGYVLWLLASRAIRLCYHFVEHPFHILYLPFFLVFQYLQAFIRIWALITILDFHWGTRDVGVGKDGLVARTGEMEDAGADESETLDMPLMQESVEDGSDGYRRKDAPVIIAVGREE